MVVALVVVVTMHKIGSTDKYYYIDRHVHCDINVHIHVNHIIELI